MISPSRQRRVCAAPGFCSVEQPFAAGCCAEATSAADVANMTARHVSAARPLMVESPKRGWLEYRRCGCRCRSKLWSHDVCGTATAIIVDRREEFARHKIA